MPLATGNEREEAGRKLSCLPALANTERPASLPQFNRLVILVVGDNRQERGPSSYLTDASRIDRIKGL